MEVPQIPFIAGDSGHSSCATQTGTTFPAALLMAAMMGFLTHFASFFALLWLAGVERQFFELSSAHNCECSRAPGGAGVAGSLTPR